MKNKFSVTFNTTDGMIHPKWVTGEGLTLQQAKSWAEKQSVNDSWLMSVDDVYEVNNDDSNPER